MVNFQIITSNKVSSKCMRAYSTSVSGCTVFDFIFGGQCSRNCVAGLEEEAEQITAACSEEEGVDADSLLGMILTGHLVDVLCPGSDDDTSKTTFTTTVEPITTTTAGFATASQDTTALPDTTRRTSLSTSVVQSQDTTTTFASPTAPSEPTATDPAADNPTTDLPTFSLGTSPISTTTLAPSPTTTADDAQPTDTDDEDDVDDDEDEDDGDDGSGFTRGGGSPFDPAPALSWSDKAHYPVRSSIIASLVSAVTAIATWL